NVTGVQTCALPIYIRKETISRLISGDYEISKTDMHVASIKMGSVNFKMWICNGEKCFEIWAFELINSGDLFFSKTEKKQAYEMYLKKYAEIEEAENNEKIAKLKEQIKNLKNK